MSLSKWRPAGVPDFTFEKVELKPFQERQHATQPLNDADEVGVALAEMVHGTPEPEHRARLRSAMEESLKQLVKFQETRGAEGND
jgi:hypothetical protein